MSRHTPPSTPKTTWKPLLEGAAAEPVLAVVEEVSAALRASPLPDMARESSLAAGRAGQALLHAYLARHTGSEEEAERAAALLEEAIDSLSDTPTGPSLYTGFSGIAWAVEHLRRDLFEDDGEDPNAEIDEALLGLLRTPSWPGEYDLIGGLVGLGVYALERLPQPAGAEMLERIVGHLWELAEHGPEGIAWFTDPDRLPPWQREIYERGNYNLGVAHGLPGVLGLLGEACAVGAGGERARPLLEGATRYLLAHKLPAGSRSIFPTSCAPDQEPGPSRLAWCYGDAGIAATLLLAARAAGRDDWEREALEVAWSGEARSERDAGAVDPGLCHGAGGLAHLFNRFWQATRDEGFAHAARAWVDRTLALRRPGEGIAGFQAWSTGPDRELGWRDSPGFLEGAAGVGLALLATISTVEPRWDRVLLVKLPVL